MQLDTIPDVKLVGRALKDWLQNDEDKRRQAVDALYDVVITNEDPEMKSMAFKALLQADVVDLKRQELEIKKRALDDARRLRLLELVKQLPPGVIARLTSGDETSVDTGRANEGQRTEGQSEGSGT